MPIVGGLSYVEIRAGQRGNQPWKYRVVQRYHYRWVRTPILDRDWSGSSQLIVTTRSGALVAGLTIQPRASGDVHSVTLCSGYAWDGSSGPLVADTENCMRASALHDVWCQAMRRDGLYKNSFRNWCRGALEYRLVCIVDGMPRWRSSVRYAGLIAKGSIDAGVRIPKAASSGVAKASKTVGRVVTTAAKAVGGWFKRLFT